jgi:2-isopropylmalate synthase
MLTLLTYKLDGTQGESVSASVDDKWKIYQRLADFEVDYIEAGWPGSNPKDAAFFAKAQTSLSSTQLSKLVAFGSTTRKEMAPADDGQVQSLVQSGAPTICIVAKGHAWQVTDILRTTRDENLRMITDTVHYLTQSPYNRNVMVDLEHFFDGYLYDAEYALQCCQAAADAGASCLVLCDTNGGTMPWQVSDIVQAVNTHLHGRVTLGIHCHNDCGMAVANSVVAVQAGVGLVQGTINGIGERTGNADLCAVMPNLALKSQSQMTCGSNLKQLTSLSRYVDEILNRTPNNAAPYVGSAAFAHKGGLHVAAMQRSSASYQHTDPSEVGNESRVLISELSGRQNIMGKLQDIGVDPAVASDRALSILNRVKDLEAKGYTFEGAEASVHLMILHANREYCAPFRVLDYTAQVYDSNMDSASRFSQEGLSRRPAFGASTARATIKVRTVNPDPPPFDPENPHKDMEVYQDVLEVGEGNGPVDALANALNRALQPVHPILEHVELVDYKVRILDPESATGASTRVMIEFRNDQSDATWTTVSVDTNVISASLNALVDGFEFALVEHAESCMLCEDDTVA